MLDAQVTDNEASGAMLHLEHCSDCTEFFGAIRLQALAHNELHAHQFDVAKCSISAVKDFFGDCDDAQIVRRLARALYQLGKAYTLMAASEDSYLLSVSEAPVDIEDFVDSEASSALADAQLAGADNSEKISLPTGKKHALAKGKSLLEQCLALKPQYSEANLYLGQIHVHLQDFEQAFTQFEKVFKGSERLVMRVHAAMQIAMVFNEQQNHKTHESKYKIKQSNTITQCASTYKIVKPVSDANASTGIAVI